MKISISNIAWDKAEDVEVAAILNKFNIAGVELAPTKILDSPISAEDDSIRNYRAFWYERNIEIVAFQALLFGKPDLCIFTSKESREKTFDYLCAIIRLAGKLGAKALVFGSPKNRMIGDLPKTEALDIATDFFSRLGEVAIQNNTHFCIEPNPEVYGCDFIRTAAEGLELVKLANHPGFRLHLDAGAMTINGEEYERVIEMCLDWTAHFHISEPNLGLIGQHDTPHQRIAQALQDSNYQGWVSIEMRNGLMAPNTDAVRKALDFVASTYC
ncbi:MAG TPA: sugar phosphate isomerase/epimerase family protein [Blastocatellia bacterium]|nr:sugar phosphate isomerase/epimerase family protein [Blastocatellia bacterium]